MAKYDYLIVGCGLFGSVFAYQARKKNKKCLIVEKRPHIGGNIFCENKNGINVHTYGAHIFHTSNDMVWDFVNQFSRFNNYINSPVANYEDKLYNLPFNMNTFYQLWGVKTPQEALLRIEKETEPYKNIEPSNLEEQALKLVGKDIYFKLIKGYTEKQWDKKAEELPSFIIKRLPLRLTFDNNYFNDKYQGIPQEGYNAIIEKLIEGTEYRLNTDFFQNKEHFESIAENILYTGMIDRYFEYCFGNLEYRSLRFEHEVLENIDNYQGNAVINYTSSQIPYTRIIEHKHFEFGTQKGTIITKEYPEDYTMDREAYYPINDKKNNELYKKYLDKAKSFKNLYFGGRLGQYAYFDMDKTIFNALELSEKIL